MERVYGAWWFVATWGLLVASAFSYIFRRSLHRRGRAAFVFHVALGVILAGALITFLSAERGYLHLRQGETLASYAPEGGGSERPLPFEVKLVLFDIEYHPGTSDPADFISFLRVDGEMCRVSMNAIHSRQGYCLCQFSHDPDEMGSTLLVNHDPWGIGVTHAGYLLLAFAMGWLSWLRAGWRWILRVLFPLAGVWIYIACLDPVTPVLRSPMLAAHVSVIVISYALLLFIAVTGVVALARRRWRDRLYRLNVRLLYPALFLLAAGIFTGAAWANISWGRYWGWDAKETWALITLLLYALPLHGASLPAFRDPVKFHLFCACALLAVAMTFFGVTYFLGGLHAYV
ncbi:MAG: cytochrome c biogenesis protein CcsA [Odoribacteraceae bacterium]|nr:cytochrome c biogenesis protein CcsA [Odoribacteraceae bacterium]